MQQSLTKKRLDDPSGADSLDTPPSFSSEYREMGLAWLKKTFDDDALLRRISTHGVVILLVVLTIGLSNLNLSWGKIKAIRPLKQPESQSAATSVTVEAKGGEALTVPIEIGNVQDEALVRAAVPHTIIPKRAKEAEILTYVVEFGDTVFDIALRYGLAPETIMWSNPSLGDTPDLLRVGQELIILPVDGVYHQVGAEDTIEGIAATFKVEPEAIINYPLNKLDPENLMIQPGQWLVVPGGTKPFVPRSVIAYSGPVPDDATRGTGIFGWPASGSITQGYWGGHRGLDIAAWLGAPIAASDSGHVVAAGWDDTGYGYFVAIDHGNGFQTLYAHLQAYYVEPGDDVAKGETIAEMGSTGNSTGPHLHFEIRQGTVQRNPYGFLP
ncbi:MAG: peptidoglycan DD-metalloendopeptidase family protein [Anaerolineae bacterium]|nr:peptidoglycan DD-metalloendopeptidase family protein [Anaerolineae bacterium]